MKIGIIGVGIVGNALKYGFEQLGHEVRVHDIKLSTAIANVLDTEIAFICVPSPSTANGECDTTIIESVIDELNSYNYAGIVAIKTTVVPGFTESIIKHYNNLIVCFVPEFLRERCAIDDFINQHSLLAVGTHDSNVYNRIVQAHGYFPKQTAQLTPTEAELLKYFNNVYAALRISFANIMYEVSNKLNCDYTTIKNSYIMTGKAKDLYLDVNPQLRGYSGTCLPKDTKALSVLIKQLDLDYELIESIHNDNEKFDKTVFPGMRHE